MKTWCIALSLALAPWSAWAQVALTGKWQLVPQQLDQIALQSGDKGVVRLHGINHYHADGRSTASLAVVVTRVGSEGPELLRLPLEVGARYQLRGNTLSETMTDCRAGTAVLHPSAKNDDEVLDMAKTIGEMACSAKGEEVSVAVKQVDANTLHFSDGASTMVYRRVK